MAYEVDEFYVHIGSALRSLCTSVLDLPRRLYGYVKIPLSYPRRRSWNAPTRRLMMSSFSSGASCDNSRLSDS